MESYGRSWALLRLFIILKTPQARTVVNRGTVYLHYADKYDLLDQCIETSLTQLTKYCGAEALPDNSPITSITRTFEYMEEHAFLYTTLLTAKGVLVNFLTYAAVGVLEWWFTNSMPYSAKDITEQLWELLERNQIVPQPLSSYQANAVKCE